MKTKNLLMQSAFYSIGNMAGAGLNMLYQFILMIFLSSEDYGIIQPLLQFLGLLILPLSAYQYSLTKLYSSMNPLDLINDSLLKFRSMFWFMLGVGVVWILIIPFLKSIFHVPDTMIFLLLMVSLLVQIIQAPFVSRLQAEKKFFIAGIAQIVQGIIRISLGVVCVWKIPNIWGAMIGIIVSNFAFVYSNLFIYQKQMLNKVPSEFSSTPVPVRLLLVSLGSVGLFSLLVYSDTVLVRSLLPSDSALFASSNLLGKGMIFLTAGVSFVVLPLMSSKVNDAGKSLWIGFSVLLALILCYVGFFAVVSPYLARILFKNDVSILTGFQYYMTYYNIMFLPYPVIYYFLNYYLVQENSFYPCLLALGVVGLYVGIMLFHSSIDLIMNVIGVVGYTLLAIVVLHSLFSKSKGRIHEEQIDEHSIDNPI